MRGKPIAIDLFCGLGGWTEGLLAEGYDVFGYDIEAHEYGDERYPAHLTLRDVLDIHGSEFAHADLIVASPPCQEYSYMAMPWSLAKAKAAAIRADDTGGELVRLNRLFNACFRIQREAIEAAGRHIPLVVENVRGAIPWVGRSRWNYGSYHLWGDVPALMPSAGAVKAPGLGHGWKHPSDPRHQPGLDFTRLAGQGCLDGHKVPGFRFDGKSKRCFQQVALDGMKVQSADGGRRTDQGKGARFTSRDCGNEAKVAPSLSRKAASARIAKIPLTLSRWIAAHYLPASMRAAA